jgi:hypothetical protein
MKKIITPILLLWTCIVLAQPIVKTDWIPGVGDVLKSVYVESQTAINPGPAGENIDYNFTELAIPDTPQVETLSVVLPGETPFGDLYSEADIAFINVEAEFYSYVKTTGGCLEDIGNTFSGQAIESYTDGIIVLCTPMNYQDEVNDTSKGTFEFLNVTTYKTGSSNIVVDGWGTLRMPGTGLAIPNTLRVKLTEVEIDSTDLGSGIREKVIYETTTYNFISADYQNILFSISESLETQIGMSDGIPNDTLITGPEYEFTYDPEPIEIGTAKVNPVDPAEVALEIFPNPVNDKLNIQFDADQSESINIQVFDLTGRLVHNEQMAASIGQNKKTLNTANIDHGMYLLTIQGKSFLSSLKFTRE